MPAKRSVERFVRNIMSDEDSVNFKLLSDIVFSDQMKNHNGESILYSDTGREDQFRMIILSNSELIQFASRCTEFQMDGTFKLCPRVYNNGLTNNGQLYSIHAKSNGILVPCFYALMARKSAAEYSRLFAKISEISSFNPSSVMIDMEQAVASTLQQLYPSCSVVFCFFHFKQSIWNWINSNGMAQKYSDHGNNVLRSVVNKHVCLAFIPPNDVIELFEEIQNSVEDSNDDDIHAFLGYFESSFIGRLRRNGQRGQARHPIEKWNQNSNVLTGSNRTNNSVEGWHHSLSTICSCDHPSFAKFLSVIKEDMSNSHIKLVQNSTGITPTPQRTTYRNLNERILNIVNMYDPDDKMATISSLSLIFHF